MKVTVHLFARAKDLAGADAVTVDVPDGTTVGELRRAVGSQLPSLAKLLERSALAVNNEFADDSLRIPYLRRWRCCRR